MIPDVPDVTVALVHWLDRLGDTVVSDWIALDETLSVTGDSLPVTVHVDALIVSPLSQSVHLISILTVSCGSLIAVNVLIVCYQAGAE